MNRDEIRNEYFEWMYNKVCKNRYSDQISYRKLLMFLHNTEFIYFIPKDENRAKDGVNLRDRFAYEYGCVRDAELYLDGPCSILEMMIALSFRCEEIMDDAAIGDRTSQWFWGMVTNLGLGSMVDNIFDKHLVEEIVTRFMYRNYEPNGRGGLFTIRRCNDDLRDVEIWYQMCWYLDTIV